MVVTLDLPQRQAERALDRTYTVDLAGGPRKEGSTLMPTLFFLAHIPDDLPPEIHPVWDMVRPPIQQVEYPGPSMRVAKFPRPMALHSDYMVVWDHDVLLHGHRYTTRFAGPLPDGSHLDAVICAVDEDTAEVAFRALLITRAWSTRPWGRQLPRDWFVRELDRYVPRTAPPAPPQFPRHAQFAGTSSPMPKVGDDTSMERRWPMVPCVKCKGLKSTQPPQFGLCDACLSAEEDPQASSPWPKGRVYSREFIRPEEHVDTCRDLMCGGCRVLKGLG
jgi:hypothetical protein